MSARRIVVVGWDGRSNPIYRFHDQLKRPDHARDWPTTAEVLAQYPEAKYTTAQWVTMPLAQAAKEGGWLK